MDIKEGDLKESGPGTALELEESPDKSARTHRRGASVISQSTVVNNPPAQHDKERE